MIQGTIKEELQPILHIPKEQKQYYDAHKGQSIDWRKHLMKPEPKQVPYVKRKLPVSGENTQKYQEIRKDLKYLRKVFLKDEPERKKQHFQYSPQAHHSKELPYFLKQNRDKFGGKSAKRSQSVINSPDFEKRIQQFSQLIDYRKVYLKREKLQTEQYQLYDKKKKATENPRQFMSVQFEGNSAQKKLKESILLKKLDPVKQRLSVASQRSPNNRKANSSLLSIGERRRRIKNPLGLIHMPTVIDSTRQSPIFSERKNFSRKRVATEFQPVGISSDEKGYQKFLEQNKHILDRLSSMLHKRERITFLQKLQKAELY